MEVGKFYVSCSRGQHGVVECYYRNFKDARRLFDSWIEEYPSERIVIYKRPSKEVILEYPTPPRDVLLSDRTFDAE